MQAEESLGGVLPGDFLVEQDRRPSGMHVDEFRQVVDGGVDDTP